MPGSPRMSSRLNHRTVCAGATAGWALLATAAKTWSTWTCGEAVWLSGEAPISEIHQGAHKTLCGYPAGTGAAGPRRS